MSIPGLFSAAFKSPSACHSSPLQTLQLERERRADPRAPLTSPLSQHCMKVMKDVALTCRNICTCPVHRPTLYQLSIQQPRGLARSGWIMRRTFKGLCSLSLAKWERWCERSMASGLSSYCAVVSMVR